MTVTILQGHCLERLRELPDESVQCVVTSPPYWRLRDYGIEAVRWPSVTFPVVAWLPHQVSIKPMECDHGLEPTIDAWIGHEVLIFREVHRVLKKNGVLWLNIGDIYAGSGRGGQGKSGVMADRSIVRARTPRVSSASISENGHSVPARIAVPPGFKEKDLIPLAWPVAMALQADGWYFRQDIIWHKRQPMPESTRDRFTKAHEYVFLLSKSRNYHWDAAAIAEPASYKTHPRGPSNWAYGSEPHDALALSNHLMRKRTPKVRQAGRGTKNNGSFEESITKVNDTRNPRSVWSLLTEATTWDHYAMFPTEIPRRCILASTSLGDTVLDPFAGTGTTGQVAVELRRKAILIELNPKDVAQIKRRTITTIGLPL